LSINLIASIHDKAIPKPKLDNKIQIAGLYCTKGAKPRIEHQLTGAISKDFNAVLANYGSGFTAS
jgi:hypothetical protein